MKIKNQLRISILAFSIILVIIAGSIIFTQQQTAQLNNQQALAQDIQARANNLAYISNDYFQNKQSVDLTSWQNQYSALLNDISQLQSTNDKETSLINNVKRDVQSADSIFNESVAYIRSIPPNQSGVVHPILKTDSNRMAVQTQALSFDAQQLTQNVRGQVDQANLANLVLIVATLGLFGAYFTTNYLITYRKTLKSISELQTGIAVIGSGNLNHSLRADNKDEIGEISKSVNQMSANLKTVTASKFDLEREIVERQKTQEALRASEQRWATTLGSIGDAVIATDTLGKVTFMNREAEELTGWILSDATQKPVRMVFNIVNEQTRLEVESPIERVLREGLVVGLANHTVLVRKDDTEVPIDDSGAPIRDKEGNITGVVLIFRDISERKKAEEALKESEAKLNAAFASMNEAVFIADTEGRLIEFNDGFVRYHRFRNREECSRTINDCPKYLEAFFADGTPAPPERWAMARALRGETAINFEYRLRRKETGEVWWGSYNFGAIRDYSGKVTGAIVTCREITERKKAEEKLEEYQKNLENLVEERSKQLKDSERLAAIGATAGMVGHDIRNPLQAITSDVYLAKTELASIPESDEKNNVKDSLTEIEKNVDYINKIVQDLQDYARPLNPMPGEADLKLVIEKLLQKNGLPKNVKVNVKVEDDAQKLVADADYLNRILYNLVTNAVQAMPNGGKLTIHVYKEANDFLITIKDTGVGIPKAIQSKMFTPMFTTKSKGQGFGLPVVKRMTESLGGTVMFQSEEGKGTTFFIRLPPNKNKM
jgi:PAS domain S-box-containing protein